MIPVCRQVNNNGEIMEEVDFKCLRCGHEYKGEFDKQNPIERTCPECGSNSIRRMKKSRKKPK